RTDHRSTGRVRGSPTHAPRRPSWPSRRRWMPDPSCRHRTGSPPGAFQHTDDVLQFGEVASPFIVFGKRRQAVGGEQFLGGVAADVPAVVAEIAGGLVAVTQINQLGEVEVETVVAPPLGG